MSGSSVTPSLKCWNKQQKFSSPTKAKLSSDGNFVCIIADGHILNVVHSKFPKEEILLSEADEYVF